MVPLPSPPAMPTKTFARSIPSEATARTLPNTPRTVAMEAPWGAAPPPCLLALHEDPLGCAGRRLVPYPHVAAAALLALLLPPPLMTIVAAASPGQICRGLTPGLTTAASTVTTPCPRATTPPHRLRSAIAETVRPTLVQHTRMPATGPLTCRSLALRDTLLEGWTRPPRVGVVRRPQHSSRLAIPRS